MFEKIKKSLGNITNSIVARINSVSAAIGNMSNTVYANTVIKIGLFIKSKAGRSPSVNDVISAFTFAAGTASSYISTNLWNTPLGQFIIPSVLLAINTGTDAANQANKSDELSALQVDFVKLLEQSKGLITIHAKFLNDPNDPNPVPDTEAAKSMIDKWSACYEMQITIKDGSEEKTFTLYNIKNAYDRYRASSNTTDAVMFSLAVFNIALNAYGYGQSLITQTNSNSFASLNGTTSAGGTFLGDMNITTANNTVGGNFTILGNQCTMNVSASQISAAVANASAAQNITELTGNFKGNITSPTTSDTSGYDTALFVATTLSVIPFRSIVNWRFTITRQQEVNIGNVCDMLYEALNADIKRVNQKRRQTKLSFVPAEIISLLKKTKGKTAADNAEKLRTRYINYQLLLEKIRADTAENSLLNLKKTLAKTGKKLQEKNTTINRVVTTLRSREDQKRAEFLILETQLERLTIVQSDIQLILNNFEQSLAIIAIQDPRGAKDFIDARRSELTNQPVSDSTKKLINTILDKAYRISQEALIALQKNAPMRTPIPLKFSQTSPSDTPSSTSTASSSSTPITPLSHDESKITGSNPTGFKRRV